MNSGHKDPVTRAAALILKKGQQAIPYFFEKTRKLVVSSKRNQELKTSREELEEKDKGYFGLLSFEKAVFNAENIMKSASDVLMLSEKRQSMARLKTDLAKCRWY